MRGAWIEICAIRAASKAAVSLPVRGAWIEMHKKRAVLQGKRSLPVRGAWIEISGGWCAAGGFLVAPRAGSVD